MASRLTFAALGIGTALVATAAFADDPVKIGMITTLSGPAGYLGEDVRDGFTLAMDEEGGKLGGADVELLVEDDGLKPENAQQIADRMLKRDGVEIVTGVIFSNISPIVAPMTIGAGKIYISPNSAPSIFAGEKCNENYFVVSWQNDSLHEAAGIAAEKAGYKSAVALAPNYQAGKDAIAGFKRRFGGEIVDEIYTQLGQTDYAAEIAKIRADKPEMVFYFLPGGMGINFMKQYDQAGLKADIPLVVSAPSLEQRIMEAVGEAALGVSTSSHWNIDLDNAANKAFVEGFRAKYDREPTPYASQGYDTAKLIASALKATGGKVSGDQDGFRTALKAADFDSVRGDFKFANNNHPIHDWYAIKAEKGPDGKLHLVTTGVIAEDHVDAYHEKCPMN
ncbi:ABC transporter substrate-binding protein [Microbaculum marinisediminis]|uniref:ABC transporter substrate-binding protein n=1 Tax=Microbaculum marinisediminis TaxID=2931392 RepID=A0AAW5R3A4_9HYPH|nr:ABC transporter substrate-binding protein [Microbaculum sp. A6E488]MCT8974730.1 ABC transporter substrate-binding protein [Microbaculum sp. A6E488]